MSRSHSPCFIEPLESRIAPAAIIIKTGVPGAFSGETDYVDAVPADNHFVDMSNPVNATDPIVQVVGNGAHSFYLKLYAGDKLQVYTGAGPGQGLKDLISGPGGAGIVGNLVAFFVDGSNGNPQDNEVQAGELVGVSLGKDSSVEISGTVHGDVVSNYNDSGVVVKTRTGGKLGATAEPAGAAHDLLLNKIKGLVISGNVDSRIMSGGDISNVKVVGSVADILGGTAANGKTYDFNGALADGGDTLEVSPAPVNAGVTASPVAKQAGVNISNVSVVSLNDVGNLVPVGTIVAGDGGQGAAGGSLTSIRIISDTSGFTLHAGNGGNGGAIKATGGLGGSVSTVLVQGLDQAHTDPTTNDPVMILGGHGGDGFNAGAGANAGNISKVYFGYEAIAGKQSVTALQDTVLIQADHGGSGKMAGNGGNLTDVHVLSAPFGAGDDLKLIAGNGGDNVGVLLNGKAGTGGGLTTIEARNVNSDVTAHNSKVILDAGHGGATTATGTGAAGGAISNAKVLGFNIGINSDAGAANGSAGNTSAGAGGSVRTLLVEEFKDSSANGIQARNAIIHSGNGADAANGKGGIGGLISSVTINNADFNTGGPEVGLEIKSGMGGKSSKGLGAAGGAITTLRVVDLNIGNDGAFTLTSGAGGDGSTGGGAGGAISDAVMSGQELSLAATSGAGGKTLAAGKGPGGNGGKISSFAFEKTPEFDSFGNLIFDTKTLVLTTGAGGAGLATGAGGAGGDALTLNLTMDDAVTVTAGAGGAGGATGASGKGGSVTTSFEQSRNANVIIAAGNGGAVGGKAGAGGSVTTAHVLASTSIAITGGNGMNGGNGGNLTNIGFSNPDNAPTSGSVTLTAGNGAHGATDLAAGNGGTVSMITGFVDDTGATLIKAGSGDSANKKGAIGGSVTDVKLYGGGGTGTVLSIEAGSASNSTLAPVGGTGGSVKGISIGVLPFDPLNFSTLAFDDTAILHHIAAGNGGNTGLATGKGGPGGSIDSVYVNHDIGVRSGFAFGFNTATEMGGLFAGSGGINTTIAHTFNTLDKKDGAAGNVTNVTADAIAAIVAGRPGVGTTLTKQNMVTKVDNIQLTGTLNYTTVNPNGSYKNFDVAKLVGGNHSATPNTTINADTFDAAEFVDNGGTVVGFSLGDTTNASTDGFIAALNLTNKRNFVPEATLTVDATGTSLFKDFSHTSTPVQPSA